MGSGMNVELMATMTIPEVQPDDQEVYLEGKGTQEGTTVEEDIMDDFSYETSQI